MLKTKCKCTTSAMMSYPEKHDVVARNDLTRTNAGG